MYSLSSTEVVLYASTLAWGCYGTSVASSRGHALPPLARVALVFVVAVGDVRVQEAQAGMHNDAVQDVVRRASNP
jgi:hypothetical protein